MMDVPEQLADSLRIFAEEVQELCEQAGLKRVSTSLHMGQYDALCSQVEAAFKDARPLKPSEKKAK